MAARLGKSFRVTPDGQVKKTVRKLDTSAKIRQKKSKRVRVVRPGTTR